MQMSATASPSTFIANILALRGKKRLALAFVAGLIGAAAMPPVSFILALCVSFPLAILLIDGAVLEHKSLSKAGVKSLFFIGLSYGFGYFLGGLWWLGAAFIAESDEFLWAMPLGVLGVPLGLGLFHGCGFVLARLFYIGNSARIISFALAMAIVEFGRAHLFTGFPWNSFGLSFIASDAFAQSAAVIGLEGQGVLALLLFSVPVLWLYRGDARRYMHMIITALALLVGGANYYYGHQRLESADQQHKNEMATINNTPSAAQEPIIRIIQPNISLNDKNSTSNGAALLSEYLRLSTLPESELGKEISLGTAKQTGFVSLTDKAQANKTQGNQSGSVKNAVPTHIIWPESPFPFLLLESKEALKRIHNALPVNTILITGAVRRPATGLDKDMQAAQAANQAASNAQEEKQDVAADTATPYDEPESTYFNSLLTFKNGRDSLELIALHDKVHLVPFGEYLPFHNIVNKLGLHQFVHVPGGFTAGKNRKILTADGLPQFLPLICYEVIFSADVHQYEGGAKLFINLTNDGWFGLTSGPYQHLATSKLRTIEFGIPMIRVANSGISSLIDSQGRVLNQIDLGVKGVITTTLSIGSTYTTYSNYGIKIHFIILFMMLTLVLLVKVYFYAFSQPKVYNLGVEDNNKVG